MWEELKTFIEVVEQQSFTKAAQKLNISQPTVSLHIRRLEELIKQITNAVLSEMGQETGSHTSSEVPSMAGRDRINEEKTSYRDYPRAYGKGLHGANCF